MGHSDEGIILVFAEILFFWVVQVNGPGCKHAAIFKFLFRDNIRFTQDDISDYLLGFTGATNVGKPLKLGIGVTFF